MTIRYVGPGGNDGNSGLTWALRKLTLNGVEDTPVVAGDTVYAGPGVYRELLTVDVSGGGVATPITYIGDVSGEHTNGVGGIVRITGSDNDQTLTRANCIVANAKDYRTFRGFMMDLTTSDVISISGNSNNWIIEDFYGFSGSMKFIHFNGTANDNIIRRGIINHNTNGYYLITFANAAPHDNAGNLIENLVYFGGRGIEFSQVGGNEVSNVTCLGNEYGVRVTTALSAGQSINVQNSIFSNCQTAALRGTALGEIVEDYNTFFGNAVDRNTVNVGANSVAYPPLFLPQIYLDGIKYPWQFGELSEWSQIARRMDAFDDPSQGIFAGVSVIEDDLFGIYRPTGVSLLSWGALQLREGERETGTKRTGTAAIVLASAGDHQMFVPVTNVSTTIEVYVYREANYEGLAPQMIIRQPGQDDEVVTDTGASGAWNQLTKTLTPAADPPYVCVILRSHNTALAGNFDVFFDDLDVS